MRIREEDEDPDVASPKKARLAAMPAKTKKWHQDAAYESWQASERHREESLTLFLLESLTPLLVESVKSEGPRNALLAELKEVLMSVDVKRVLQDLGELAKL